MKIFTLTIFILLLGCSQRDSAIKENHKLYIPDGDGSFPVVIAIPGCSGVSLNGNETDIGRPGDEGDRLFRRHYPRMAKRLKDNGFMVYLIDYLTAEGELNTCSGEIHPKKVGEYINESISFVKKNPDIDTNRIYIIGWSHGGSGLLEWLSSLEEEPKDVNSAIAIYPGCSSRNPWKTSLPVLMVLGEADDIAIPTICKEVVQSLPDHNNVTLLSYPDARHGFDFTEGPSVLSVGEGITVGRNQKAGDEAWMEILLFLNQNN